jgi:hypothetical protein
MKSEQNAPEKLLRCSIRPKPSRIQSMSYGFHRIEPSRLAREAGVVTKLGHARRKSIDLVTIHWELLKLAWIVLEAVEHDIAGCEQFVECGRIAVPPG